MNLPKCRQVLECAAPAALSISQAGSWSHYMRKSERRLSRNLVAATVKRRQMSMSENQPPGHRVTATDTVTGPEANRLNPDQIRGDGVERFARLRSG